MNQHIVRRTVGLLSVLVMLAGLCPIAASAAIAGGIDYQGYLTDSVGSPVNAPVSVTFSLYNVAAGGVPLWSDTQVVTADSGLFSVQLGGGGNPFPEGVFAEPLWLAIEVAGDAEMIPRRPVLSAGYAYMADDAFTLEGFSASSLDQSAHVTDRLNPHRVTAAQVNAATAADLVLHVADASAHHAKTTSFSELTGLVADSQIPAIITRDTEIRWDNLSGIPTGFADGIDNNSGGDITAVYGGTGLNGGGSIGAVTLNVDVPLQLSGTGTGVIQGTHSTSGNWGYLGSGTYGVRGQSEYISGRGVYGRATHASGTNYGVYGYSISTGGRGVYGGTSASEGTTYGVYGSSASNAGRGVYGYAYSSGDTSNINYGGYFESRGTRGIGVYGKASYSGSGLKYGGYFEVDSDTGYGVYSTVNGDYTNYAFRGEATGPGSNGAWFSTVGENTSAVRGVANGTTGTYNTNKGGSFGAAGNRGYGVHSTATGTYGTGIYTAATGAYGIGIRAQGGSDGYAAVLRGNVQLQRRSDGATVMELGEGLDYAEGFDVSGDKVMPAGTVLVIDALNPGKLAVSSAPYDTKVAGIIAGARGMGSGVRLGAGQFDSDVALAGRVYCNVDAREHGIEPGDLLTTSPSSGHAMKVTDHVRAQGAILGKAMEAIERGRRGQILVLVTLQ